MAPLVVDPSGYLKPHHSVGHCRGPIRSGCSTLLAMPYRKVERISLREHPTLDERWLQDRLEADPGLLGLGDLRVLAREKYEYRERSPSRFPGRPADDDAGADPEGD